MDLGHEVHVVTKKLAPFADRYTSVTVYHDQDQLFKSIELHKDADIFHAHNEPSWFVNAVKAIYPNIPIVLDVHDSFLIRHPETETDPEAVRVSVNERDNMQLADGLVFVSDPMAEICRNTFDLDQPCISLPSYIPREFYRIDAFRWVGGIVYEGRVDLTEKLEGHAKFFAYCDYRKLAEKLAEIGMLFFLFAPNRDIKEMNKAYNGHALFQQGVAPHELIRKLGSHNYGLLGNIDVHEAWKYAMPNKLFDYLAGGVPIIAMNAPLAGKFIEEHGFGMNITDPGEIKELWPKHREYRKNIALKRFDWCMDNHIYKVLELYEKLLG